MGKIVNFLEKDKFIRLFHETLIIKESGSKYIKKNIKKALWNYECMLHSIIKGFLTKITL